MPLKRFKTDRRLWFWISIALFIVPWFIPMFGKDSAMRPMDMFFVLVSSVGSDVDMFGALAAIGFYTVLLGIPAAVMGWVLQGLIVMLKSPRKDEDAKAS